MLNKSYFYLQMVILVFFLFILNGALSQDIKAPASSNSILMGNGNLKSGVYALLVGINKYENLDNLKYAEKDVRDFAIFLNEVFNENLKLDTLTNTEAKLDKIFTSIGHAQNKDFGELKKAYLLFSVHGGQKNVNDKEVYLFVNENQYPNDNMGKGLFRMKYLKNLVDLFTNEGVMVILILDACHAGSINPQKIHQTINSWNNDKISVKFLACLEDEKALESDSLQNGVLTHYFLKGARSEANSDANDMIDVNEMRKYLVRKVTDDALKINKKQTPLIIGKDSLIIAVLNKKDKIQPLKAIHTDTESAVKTDSLKNIEDSFKKSLEKEDLNDAFNWLIRYKAHDSVSLSYHQLKYKYISTCYNVSVDLSEKLVGLTLNSFTQVKNSALFKSTDIFIHATVSNRLVVIENLKKCLTLLKITEPFYEEISYRLLIVEGYKQKDLKKIDNANQINPDFAYPYLFLAYINCKNENYVDCIKDLGKYKQLSGDDKVIDEVMVAVEGLRKRENAGFNVCDPTQPRILVLPSDNMLSQLKSIKEIKSDTIFPYYVRQYEKAFMEQTDLSLVLSGINGKFSDRGFPLESLQESLKDFSANSSLDNIRGLQEDELTQVLSSAKPDIIVEVAYKYNKGTLDNSLNFVVEVKDAYTRKVIVSVANPGLETHETNVAGLIAGQVEKNILNIQELMQNHLKDLREKGRMIQLRVRLMGSNSFTFDDECNGEEYEDVVRDVIRIHSNNEAINALMAGPSEMRFTNIRIPLCNEKGYPMDANDWVKKVAKDLEKRCGVKAKNATQGLGDAFIILTDK